MMRRLAQRRKLVIGGCIFAAAVLGVVCTGITPAHAASCEISMQATGDQMVLSSSDWSWTASDGDLSKVPPLIIGQEVIRGGYSGSVLVAGPGMITTHRGLSTDEIFGFSTDQKVESNGPAILSESLFVGSCGSPAAGVTCGSDSLDAEGANLTRQAYCEYVGASTMFMTNALNYQSAGGISQGDIELPDSMAMNMDATGHGSGQFSLGSRSLIGIGNTSDPGYVHSINEETRADGAFMMRSQAAWSSFTSLF